MRKMRKTALGFMGAGLAMGVGTNILSDKDIGSPNASKAVGNLSATMPMLGTLYGAKMTLDALNSLSPKKRRKL